MPLEQQKSHDPAILIWVPVGEAPTRHAFAASGASTFSFLPDAVIHAQKEAAHRPEKPWISTSNVMFGPDQIRVLYATSQRKGPLSSNLAILPVGVGVISLVLQLRLD